MKPIPTVLALLILLALIEVEAVPRAQVSPRYEPARPEASASLRLKRHGEDAVETAEHAMPVSDESAMSVDHGDSDEPAETVPSAFAPTHYDGSHHQHSNAAPLTTLNETQILLTHDPDPPAYYQLDGYDAHRDVLIAHVSFMSLAYFVLLPLALFLKSGRSQLSLVAQFALIITSVIGTLLGTIYKADTPELYAGNSHSPLGWATVALTIGVNSLDVMGFTSKVKRFLQSRRMSASRPRADDEEERKPFVLGGDESDGEDVVDLAGGIASPTRSSSSVSDATLHEHHQTSQSPRTLPSRNASRVHSIVSSTGTVVQQALVLVAWAEVISGIAVYSGSCRERYINGCLAHLIKGSIFLWYGLLTWARFIGCFSSLGWAWNRRPAASGTIWTAEAVESAVIFTYGISNTWLERLGKTGSWGVKDYQHAGIAVMFWFAGALGLLLESRAVRSWLSYSAVIASGRPSAEVAEPASYSFSFNPFPALVIGITGVAMAAHHQTYQFQVDIHALWGMLLAGFALFRFLTYFFLYLRPPASVLPSRPPTEALASFCLCSGGVVFMLSTEQITFAAMRNEYDDVMSFLCCTVALVCVWFTWTLCLFAIKGWALTRGGWTNDSSHQPHRSVSMSLERLPSSSHKPN